MGRVPRRPSRPPRGTGLLHHLAAVLNLAGRRQSTNAGSAPQRRRRQRLSLAQRLLDPLPPGLRTPDQGAERFWRLVRWGGLGLLLGRWLAP